MKRGLCGTNCYITHTHTHTHIYVYVYIAMPIFVFDCGGRDVELLLIEGDKSGRFVKYDPATKETTVLIDNLEFGNGVAISKDGTFVVVAETSSGR